MERREFLASVAALPFTRVIPEREPADLIRIETATGAVIARVGAEHSGGEGFRLVHLGRPVDVRNHKWS